MPSSHISSWTELLVEVVDFLFVQHPHFVLEAGMGLLLLYVVLKKPIEPKTTRKLTEAEQEELINEFQPRPLHEALNDDLALDAENVPEVTKCTETTVTTADGKELLNLASLQVLGMSGRKDVEEVCEVALRKYGCGSCGPRGFYGSLDVHLKLEEEIAQFMGTEQAILYSSNFATLATAIPTFAKKGDVLFCDKGVSYAVQVGVSLSRGDVVWFDHNDTGMLEEMLKKYSAKYASKRKFVIVEGLYQNYGDIAPLPKLVALKAKYHLYLLIDESNSIGVLGRRGRGITDHFSVPISEVDIVLGSLASAFGSVGGFCCGSKVIVNHQRLNASGYVFSAALPPFLSTAASKAIAIVSSQPELLTRLRNLVRIVFEEFSKNTKLVATGSPESPIVHLCLAPTAVNVPRVLHSRLLQKIVDRAAAEGVLLTRAKYVSTEAFMPPPSIRLGVLASIDEDKLRAAVRTVARIANEVL